MSYDFGVLGWMTDSHFVQAPVSIVPILELVSNSTTTVHLEPLWFKCNELGPRLTCVDR